MNEQQNLEISKQFYTLIEQGDCTPMMPLLAEEIDWHGLTIEGGQLKPKRLKGAQSVIDFLSLHDQIIERNWVPETFFVKGDRVIVLGKGKYTSKITQYILENEFIHALKVENGKIKEFFTYFDLDTVLLLANNL